MSRTFKRLPPLMLLLCIATALLWVRSYFYSDNFFRVRSSGTTTFYSERCALHCSHTPEVATDARGFRYERISDPFHYQCIQVPVFEEIRGRFEWQRGREFIVGVPYWAITLPLLLYNVAWTVFRGWSRRTRLLLLAFFAFWPLWCGQVIHEPRFEFEDNVYIVIAAVILAMLCLGGRDTMRNRLAGRPLPWEWRLRRQMRRRRSGLCVTCGYNLCASRDRCPECGTTFYNHTARLTALVSSSVSPPDQPPIV